VTVGKVSDLLNRTLIFSSHAVRRMFARRISDLVLGNKSMKCVLCKHGTTYTGTVNVTLERDNCIIVLKDVPADICENCGEYYLNQNTTAAVLDRAEKSIYRNAEVEILRFAA
jgi:YgiT-type zinc finger domain-containing protein